MTKIVVTAVELVQMLHMKREVWSQFNFLKEFKLLESVAGQPDRIVVGEEKGSKFLLGVVGYIWGKYGIEPEQQNLQTGLSETGTPDHPVVPANVGTSVASNALPHRKIYIDTNSNTQLKYQAIARAFQVVHGIKRQDVSRYSISAEKR